jgi:hypothetical protein
MTRVTKMGHGKFSVARGIHCCPILLLLFIFIIYFAQPAFLYCEELRVKHFSTHRERYVVLTGCLSLGCQPGGDWANN